MFCDDTLLTFFRRLSWSPDGMCVVYCDFCMCDLLCVSTNPSTISLPPMIRCSRCGAGCFLQGRHIIRGHTRLLCVLKVRLEHTSYGAARYTQGGCGGWGVGCEGWDVRGGIDAHKVDCIHMYTYRYVQRCKLIIHTTYTHLIHTHTTHTPHTQHTTYAHTHSLQ